MCTGTSHARDQMHINQEVIRQILLAALGKREVSMNLFHTVSWHREHQVTIWGCFIYTVSAVHIFSVASLLQASLGFSLLS
jgi:hypothetical protein